MLLYYTQGVMLFRFENYWVFNDPNDSLDPNSKNYQINQDRNRDRQKEQTNRLEIHTYGQTSLLKNRQ